MMMIRGGLANVVMFGRKPTVASVASSACHGTPWPAKPYHTILSPEISPQNDPQDNNAYIVGFLEYFADRKSVV